MSILEIIHQLKQTSSRNEKEAILNKHALNDDLKRVFELALDPILNFHIKKIPDYCSENVTVSLKGALEQIVDQLTTRKVTGNDAKAFLKNILSSVSPDDAQVIELVIDRDLQCGVQASTVNKVWPDLVHEFPVMLASKITDVKIEDFPFPAYVQKKRDGTRVQVVVKDNLVTLYTRNGKTIDVLGVFDETFADYRLNGYVFDGEIVAQKDGKDLDRSTSNGLVNKAIKGKISKEEAELLHITLWDCISLADWKREKSSVPYYDRLSRLVSFLDESNKISIEVGQYVDDLERVQELFDQAIRRGEEGVMLKVPNGIWESKRVKTQVKYKGIYDADLVCVGWEEGTKKNAGILGALVCETSDGKLRVGVGTGFKQHQRESIKPENIIGKIIAVKYNCVVKDKRTNTYSMFLPRFIEVRFDKDTADTFDSLTLA